MHDRHSAKKFQMEGDILDLDGSNDICVRNTIEQYGIIRVLLIICSFLLQDISVKNKTFDPEQSLYF